MNDIPNLFGNSPLRRTAPNKHAWVANYTEVEAVARALQNLHPDH